MDEHIGRKMKNEILIFIEFVCLSPVLMTDIPYIMYDEMLLFCVVLILCEGIRDCLCFKNFKQENKISQTCFFLLLSVKRKALEIPLISSIIILDFLNHLLDDEINIYSVDATKPSKFLHVLEIFYWNIRSLNGKSFYFVMLN